jgi:hypothetical protein
MWGCCWNALLSLFIGWTSCPSLFARDFNLTGRKNLQGGYPLKGDNFRQWMVNDKIEQHAGHGG